MTSPTAAESATPINKPRASNVVPLRRVDGMPPAPPAEAWHGPMGEYARMVDPYTEADPVAILTQDLGRPSPNNYTNQTITRRLVRARLPHPRSSTGKAGPRRLPRDTNAC